MENCSGCLRPESCPCPKAIRRAKQKQQQRRRETGRRDDDDAAPGRSAVLSALGAVAMGVGGVVVPGNPAVAMENGLISEAWSAISGAPSDLTFPRTSSVPGCATPRSRVSITSRAMSWSRTSRW